MTSSFKLFDINYSLSYVCIYYFDRIFLEIFKFCQTKLFVQKITINSRQVSHVVFRIAPMRLFARKKLNFQTFLCTNTILNFFKFWFYLILRKIIMYSFCTHICFKTVCFILFYSKKNIYFGVQNDLNIN